MKWGTRTGQHWTRSAAPPMPEPPAGDPYAHPKPVYAHDVECRPYWVFVRDEFDPDRIILGYLGETSQRDPLTRFAQHMGDGTAYNPGQPWSDLLPVRDPQEAHELGFFVFADQTWPNKTQVWEVEKALIERDKPRYNYEYNLGNPERVTIPDARRARAERDRAAGIPEHLSWAALFAEHEARKRPVGAHRAAVPSRWRLPKLQLPQIKMRKTTRRRLLKGAGALTAALVLWVLAARYAPIAPTLRLGGMCALLVAWVLTWRRRRRGQLQRFAVRLLRVSMFVMLNYLWWGVPVLTLLGRRR